MAPTILLGAITRFFVLKSGVHATLAGVVAAFCIPLKDKWGKPPLQRLEAALSPCVLYLIVPLFAVANAGVLLSGLSFADLFRPFPLGIAAGLVLGKQIGVFGTSWLMVRSSLARLPKGANWMQLYGIACLAGIGFTMSLFIGGLSHETPDNMNDVRLGVLSGSIVSAGLGYAALMLSTGRESVAKTETPAAAE